MEIDRNGLEVLERAVCMDLLRTAAVGRIAITSGALPMIVPVNFRVAGDRIVFRTGTGTKLAAATRSAVVAFEVDDIDVELRTGWSVLVTGVARQIRGSSEDDLHLTPRWAPGQDGHLVSISMDIVSGRRLAGEELPSGAELHDSA